MRDRVWFRCGGCGRRLGWVLLGLVTRGAVGAGARCTRCQRDTTVLVRPGGQVIEWQDTMPTPEPAGADVALDELVTRRASAVA